MNDAWTLAPWADVLYACDGQWWDAKRPRSDDAFGGLRCSQDEHACARHGLDFVPSKVGAGLCLESWVINQGLNSGYQAMNLAYHFGASRMLLLGFDMQRTNGRSHWFGDHPGKLNVPSPYDEFVKRFGPLAKDLDAQGVQVVNCSTSTALECFPRGHIFEELELS